MTRFNYATIVTAAGLIATAALPAGTPRVRYAELLLAAYVIISGLGVFAPGLNYYCRSARRGKPGAKRIALSFDDGPDREATPALLDVLQAHKARATFFCTGERAEGSVELLKRIVAEGHTLGNHSYRHKWWTNFLTGRPLKAEILRAQQVLGDLSGVTPEYYRSPMGLTNPHLEPVLRETGLKLVGWDVRPYDRGTPAKVTAARIIGAARDGSIVLLHDGGAAAENLAAAVTEVLEHFQGLGYSFVSLNELFKEE